MVRTWRLLFLTLVLALVLALSLGAIVPVLIGSPVISVNDEPPPEPEPEPEPEPPPEEPTMLASLYVRDLNVAPIYAQPRQAVSVNANVANEGETWGSKTVYLVVNGETEQTKSVGVSPHTSHPVSFVVYRVVAGEYNIQIGNESGTFYIAEEAPAESGGYGPLDTGGIIAIVVIGVILVGGLVIVFVLSRGI